MREIRFSGLWSIGRRTLVWRCCHKGLGCWLSPFLLVLGLGLAHTIVRHKGSWISNILSQLAYVPLFIPSIALAAAYIALYGAPIGPMPALYGTFLLLVLAATAYLLPYAVQSGRSVLSQISADIEEAAKLTGASTLRRMLAIVFPLTIRGLLAGGMLVFIKIVRDLSLVVLLFLYHVIMAPVVIDDPIGAMGMMLLAWFSGFAVGIVFWLVLLVFAPPYAWTTTGVLMSACLAWAGWLAARGRAAGSAQ